MTIALRRVPGLDVVRRFSLDIPTAGIDLQRPGLFIDRRSSPRIQNARLYHGEITNRPGTVRFPDATLDNIPLAGGLHQRVDRTTYTLVGTRSKMYYFDTGSSTWTDTTDYMGFPGFTGADSDPWSFAVYDNDIVFSQGADKLWRWNSPSVDLGNGAGKVAELSNSFPARHLLPYADRIIAAHTTESGTTFSDRIRWCAAGDISTWDPTVNTSAGFLDTVDLEGAITGSSRLGSFVYIFKRNGIIRMAESGLLVPSFIFQTVVDGVGCVAGRTLVKIGQLLFFLGEENVYAWAGTGRPTAIGNPVISEINDLLDRALTRQAFAFDHPLFDEYWLCITPGGAAANFPSLAYVFNYRDNSWTKHIIDATCSVPHKSAGEDQQIDSATDPIDTYLRSFDSGTEGADIFITLIGRDDLRMYQLDDTAIADDGNAITVEFNTSDTDADAPALMKTVNRIGLMVRAPTGSADLTLEYSTDCGTTWQSLGTQTTTNVGCATVWFDTRFTAQYARLRITSTDAFALQRFLFDVFDRSEGR